MPPMSIKAGRCPALPQTDMTLRYLCATKSRAIFMQWIQYYLDLYLIF